MALQFRHCHAVFFLKGDVWRRGILLCFSNFFQVTQLNDSATSLDALMSHLPENIKEDFH